MSETVSLEFAIEVVLRDGPTFETIAGLCKMAVEAEREWVGLTDDEIQECISGLPTQTMDVYARRIEAKLKEKNV